MHIIMIENTLKCYKWHKHISFDEDILLDIDEEVINKKHYVNNYHVICIGVSGSK